MANHTGHRGTPWTDEEAEALLVMVAEKRPQAEISKLLGRSISSVEGKIRTIRETESMGAPRGRGLARYDIICAVDNDELLHLRGVIKEGGFRWLPDSLAKRFYELEWAPQARPFWNAA